MHDWTLLALDVEAPDGSLGDGSAVASLAAALGELLAVELPHRIDHLFQPQGVSSVAVGQGGRVSIHTWPEWRAATIDLWVPRSALPEALEARIESLAARHGLTVLRLWRPSAVSVRSAGARGPNREAPG